MTGSQGSTASDAGPKDPSGAAPPLRDLLAGHLPELERYVLRRMGPILRQRESAADLVHSVCGDLLGEEPRFEYRGEEQFQHWLRAVVLNKIRGRLRKLGAQKRGPERRSAMSDTQLIELPGEAETPPEQAIRNEGLELLGRALTRLPVHYREVIVRTRILGHSREQVAEAMGRSEASTRNLLTRALVMLARVLDQLRD